MNDDGQHERASRWPSVLLTLLLAVSAFGVTFFYLSDCLATR